ncbi:Formiminotransferase, N-terminal subdomain containing protein [Parasponia andersonii]|uniref:Formiminotransferase, N-terminal subdomain containing protein n=1 Tax=Parasponia andersonii TaxID=3476 RepID=A0A2P5E4W0_PARAD|nr:Formiminotransferase, N-terminal subdomain containing protein [Parasponia andersonii]
MNMPVYLYAAAQPTGKALDTIRWEVDDFRPSFMGNHWAGWTMPEDLPEKPDEGPTSVSRARGITMIEVWM